MFIGKCNDNYAIEYYCFLSPQMAILTGHHKKYCILLSQWKCRYFLRASDNNLC